MKKEEFIARYGEDAYNKSREQGKSVHKQRADYYNSLARKYHKERLENNPDYKDHRRILNEKAKSKLVSLRGETYNFINSQISMMSLYPVDDLDKYIIENLTKEAAEIDGDPRFIDEDFLYDCFLDNCRYGLFYGNIQVIKYFVPLMCIKAHKGIKFTDKNIEMIKVFDEYKNPIKKRPIKYSFKLYYIRPDQKNDIDISLKCMLLYNLSADFMINRSRYSTDKKLY